MFIATVGKLTGTAVGVKHNCVVGFDREAVIREALDLKKLWEGAANKGPYEVWVGTLDTSIITKHEFTEVRLPYRD